jgi:hypothetical protein
LYSNAKVTKQFSYIVLINAHINLCEAGGIIPVMQMRKLKLSEAG